MFTVEEMNPIQAMNHTCRRIAIFDIKISIPNIKDHELKELCEKTLQACKCADEEAKQSVLAKLKEQQLHEPPRRPERPFIFCGPEE